MTATVKKDFIVTDTCFSRIRSQAKCFIGQITAKATKTSLEESQNPSVTKFNSIAFTHDAELSCKKLRKKSNHSRDISCKQNYAI